MDPIQTPPDGTEATICPAGYSSAFHFEILHSEERERHHDPRSTEELVQAALVVDAESETYENLLWALRYRATQEVFDTASNLCSSSDARQMVLGADILGQIDPGPVRSRFSRQAITVLLKMVVKETERDVLLSVISSLGHQRTKRSIPTSLRFKNDPDPEIRRAVTRALWCLRDQAAIDALIELSTDSESIIRDWATFGLGRMINVDTPAIRETLFNRVSDPDDNTSSEAVAGLAKRHDERAINPLMDSIQARCFGPITLESAAAIGSSRLFPALVALKESGVELCDLEKHYLDEAIKNCRPKKRRRKA